MLNVLCVLKMNWEVFLALHLQWLYGWLCSWQNCQKWIYSTLKWLKWYQRDKFSIFLSSRECYILSLSALALPNISVSVWSLSEEWKSLDVGSVIRFRHFRNISPLRKLERHRFSSFGQRCSGSTCPFCFATRSVVISTSSMIIQQRKNVR